MKACPHQLLPEKESGELELASGCHPAKNDISLRDRYFLLTGCPLLGTSIFFVKQVRDCLQQKEEENGRQVYCGGEGDIPKGQLFLRP
jgi:hypothetical protein